MQVCRSRNTKEHHRRCAGASIFTEAGRSLEFALNARIQQREAKMEENQRRITAILRAIQAATDDDEGEGWKRGSTPESEA
jgi:hypothetical protein